MTVNDTGVIYNTDDSGNRTTEITGYTITCSAYRGDELKIKFPTNVADKIADLNQQLKNDIEIEVAFVNLKLTPYALKTKSGDVISGVSAKADDFTIVSANLPELLDDDIIL
jgi:hypothetical protein